MGIAGLLVVSRDELQWPLAQLGRFPAELAFPVWLSSVQPAALPLQRRIEVFRMVEEVDAGVAVRR